MNKIKLILLSFLMLGSLAAQDLSKLSPEQLAAYKQYTQGKNATESNSVKENVVQERVVEYDDDQQQNTYNNNNNKNYQKNNNNYNNNNNKNYKNNNNQKNLNNNYLEGKVLPEKAVIFGSHLFSKQNLTFEPKLNIATPTHYILGTYDELIIDISGYYEANYKLKVSTEGTIRIPNVGPVKVSGLTMESASRAIRNKVSQIYMGVSSGQTHVNVSLGNIRSIRVTVVGEATRPGSYTLPSLATAFNALYACGGPDSLGSMRDIKVIRAGKIIANIDVYRFLFDGVISNNISLRDDDVVKIEPYGVRATITGSVKHGGLFEVLPGETMQNLIRFSGGFNDKAYQARITNFRLTDKGKTVVDVADDQFSTFRLQSGDSCVVAANNNVFDNRVDIIGSVFRPGTYALEPGLTVKQLIAKAEGVKEDAYLNMAYITRKKENQIPEIVGFNLGKVLDGTAEDILLQKDDSIKIRSLFDYREKQSVSIWGAVKEPGSFELIENISLKDLIYKAFGFSEMASTDSVELIRVIKDQETLLNTNMKTRVMKFALDKDMKFANGSGDILLENGDQVIVRAISGYEGVRMVRILGEVIKPGNYNITNKAEKISDLIQRAGGFSNYAYPLGAFLIRSEKVNAVEEKLQKIVSENTKTQLQNKEDGEMDVTLLKATGSTSMQDYTTKDSVQRTLSGANVEAKLFKSEGIVGINLVEIMKNPGGEYDLNLEEGDVINVPRELQTVRVLGEVLFPTYVRYDKEMSFKDYISNAGGFSERAQKRKAFVLYANGTAKSTKRFLGIKIYPNVMPGARVVVPQQPVEIKNKMTAGESITMMSSLASVMALIYSLLR